MQDQPLPFRTHSGEYLKHHPVSEYGCTICHDGQGWAPDRKNAHARNEAVEWPWPLQSLEYVQSACGQCHLALFLDSDPPAGTATYVAGYRIFRREGCLGCHKARGLGGMLGPDLTAQGHKTQRDYNFANITGERTVVNWLREHFKDPEMVSPGSRMLALELPESEIQALVTFTMGLAKPEIPFTYLSLETLEEFKGRRPHLSGEEGFPMLCSACHGKAGEGKSYRVYDTGIPGIGRDDFLSVASADLIAFSVYHGRGGRPMPSWLPRNSGLRPTEITELATYVKSLRQVRSRWDEVRSLPGNETHGQMLFAGHCAVCHGNDGQGLPVITISNPDLMAAASDEFLYRTLVRGRGHTAMPGWGRFSSQEMAHLLTFLRSWGSTSSPEGRTPAAQGKASRGEGQFHYLCSRCHGLYGQGDTGPAILNPDFQAAASESFLYAMIARGRRGTAMFGWSADVAPQERLTETEMADVIAYLRAAAAAPPEVIFPGPNFGAAEDGRPLYGRLCVECHGSEGEGLKAPALNNQELLNAATNGYLFATLTLGREATDMPPWGRGKDKYRSLNVQERYHIVTFLRSWQRVVIKKILAGEAD
jgi:mono/diheme cytochrome c family protein